MAGGGGPAFEHKKLHFFGRRVPRFACQTVRSTPAPPIDKQSVAPLDVATFLCCPASPGRAPESVARDLSPQQFSNSLSLDAFG